MLLKLQILKLLEKYHLSSEGAAQTQLLVHKVEKDEGVITIGLGGIGL